MWLQYKCSFLERVCLIKQKIAQLNPRLTENKGKNTLCAPEPPANDIEPCLVARQRIGQLAGCLVRVLYCV